MYCLSRYTFVLDPNKKIQEVSVIYYFGFGCLCIFYLYFVGCQKIFIGDINVKHNGYVLQDKNIIDENIFRLYSFPFSSFLLVPLVL